jgi:hypothetical protein
MPSNLDYNPNLLHEAQRLGGFRYKKDAVNAALKEFIEKRRQLEIIELFNTIEIDPTYDHKQGRKRA